MGNMPFHTRHAARPDFMHDLLPLDVESACKSFTNNDRREVRFKGSEV